MTSITRNNELNSVVASLLAPTVVSQISKPSASALLSQQDGGGTGAPAFAVPSHKADVPLEFAPLSSGSTGTQQSLPSPIEAAFSLQATSQPDASAVAGPVMIGQESPAATAIMAPSFAFGGEGAQAIQSAEPAVLMDPVTAPVLAVAIAHDDTVGFFCMCTACTGADAKPTPPAIIGPAAGDDIPDDITSTVTIAVGGTLSSSIQSAGDKDYIKVSLVAGQTYTFSLESTGLVDPYVELRDGSNVLLKDNDDGGILYDSFLTYTPTVSGDYFIVARDYGSDTGGYALTVEAITTGNSSPTTFISNGKTLYSWDESAIQISRTGASWATDFDSSAVVTYAYRSTAPTTMPSDTAGFTRFTAAQIAANDAALAAWAEVANITFVRVGTGTAGEAAYSNTATMLFSNYGSGASGAAAFAYLPSTANTASSSAQGDVWINSSLSYNANPVIGEYGPHVLLHEIGHAIGLSHPGEYNAAPGVSITYPANAEYFNDSRMFTSMSYFGSSSTGGNLQAFASTPSLHDIAAAQRLYGANMTTRTGDTVYGFNSNTGVAAFVLTLPSQVSVFSIWDAGGNDTLDLSGYTQNATIDLREEAFTSAGGGTHNISIARGAVIENAIGGSGNDTVTGNAANNTLNGGAGFDTLNGNEGNDLLLGGAGGDVLNGGAGTDTVSYETSSDYVFVDLQSGTIFGGDASSDTISGVENIIGTTFNDTLGGDANANTLSGLAGNDTLVGRGGNDTIDTGSGDDIVDGGDGSDTINLGAFFTALDSINGGADSDTLNLNGDYSAGITLSDTTLTNVERINLTAGNSYRLTLADATVAAGTQMIIDGSTLAAGQTLTVIATAETDGTFDLRGGAGNDAFSAGAAGDSLFGGDGNDGLGGAGGADILVGGAGNDTLDGGDGWDLTENGKSILRLYEATLDRPPDVTGFRSWASALGEGQSLVSIASGFVSSTEFQNVYGALNNTQFVTLLYNNVLDRAPDTPGLDYWTSLLSGGASRAEVVVGFSESQEFRNSTVFDTRAFATLELWEPGQIYRLYFATLDRAPDVGGFENWMGALGNGAMTFTQVVSYFVSSDEFQQTYGTTTDTQFVTLLYSNVLDRAPDPAGLNDWLTFLSSGGTREQVVIGFSESNEFKSAKSLDLFSFMQVQMAHYGDTLSGGVGSDVMIGGFGMDRFDFNALEHGQKVIYGLDQFDILAFNGFGYADKGSALTHFTQQGADLLFSDQGASIFFHNTTLADIANNSFMLANGGGG